MTEMTKTEVLSIWRGFVKHMTDEGAVFPFANEIARLTRNEMLDRLEEAEKERNWNAERLEDAIEECTALRTRIERMERELRLIAETDPIDAALDPQRAIRIARTALGESK